LDHDRPERHRPPGRVPEHSRGIAGPLSNRDSNTGAAHRNFGPRTFREFLFRVYVTMTGGEPAFAVPSGCEHGRGGDCMFRATSRKHLPGQVHTGEIGAVYAQASGVRRTRNRRPDDYRGRLERPRAGQVGEPTDAPWLASTPPRACTMAIITPKSAPQIWLARSRGFLLLRARFQQPANVIRLLTLFKIRPGAQVGLTAGPASPGANRWATKWTGRRSTTCGARWAEAKDRRSWRCRACTQ